MHVCVCVKERERFASFLPQAVPGGYLFSRNSILMIILIGGELHSAEEHPFSGEIYHWIQDEI